MKSGSEIIDALGMIAKEKGVDREYLLETLREGLLAAAQKRHRRAVHVEVDVDPITGRIRIIVHKKVVAVAVDLTCEIDLEDARAIRPGVQVGDIVPVEVPLEEFGRSAVTAVKQALVQRVREKERALVYEEYAPKIGQVLSGTVQQVDRGSIILKIGRTEGIIPAAENIRRDRPKIGDHMRALLVDVDRNARGPQLILSRTRKEFVLKLFEQEVPEVFERVVEIRAIAREPGSRTKVAVVSHDDRVDAVGACVGVKGSRVQNIVKELGGERVDIVPYSSDPVVFVSRALSPARVLDVRWDEEAGCVRAVIPDDQLALAMGRGAQNVKLAHELTGYTIHLISQRQAEAMEGREAQLDVDLEELTKELGPKLVEKLLREGKETLRDVLSTPAEELMKIPGIGEKTAQKLLTLSAQILEERARQMEEAAKEEGEAPEQPGEELPGALIVDEAGVTPVAPEALRASAEAGATETRAEPEAEESAPEDQASPEAEPGTGTEEPETETAPAEEPGAGHAGGAEGPEPAATAPTGAEEPAPVEEAEGAEEPAGPEMPTREEASSSGENGEGEGTAPKEDS
jgi:N utilization substance protein A